MQQRGQASGDPGVQFARIDIRDQPGNRVTHGHETANFETLKRMLTQAVDSAFPKTKQG